MADRFQIRAAAISRHTSAAKEARKAASMTAAISGTGPGATTTEPSGQPQDAQRHQEGASHGSSTGPVGNRGQDKAGHRGGQEPEQHPWTCHSRGA